MVVMMLLLRLLLRGKVLVAAILLRLATTRHLYSTVQCITVQYSALQYSTVL